MLEKLLITSQKNQYSITSEDPTIIDWFERAYYTHTDIIIDQLNNDHLYDRFFTGRKDLVAIDCGANIGLWSIYAQDSCSKLIAVEPSPSNFQILEKFTSVFPNVIRDMSALHGENVMLPFYIHDVSPTCNSSVNESGQRIDVPGKTIERILQDHGLDHVDVVKCDIEGSEIVALTEATIDPVKNKISNWFVEVHHTSVGPGGVEANRQHLDAIFRNAGYSTESVAADQLFAWK